MEFIMKHPYVFVQYSTFYHMRAHYPLPKAPIEHFHHPAFSLFDVIPLSQSYNISLSLTIFQCLLFLLCHVDLDVFCNKWQSHTLLLDIRPVLHQVDIRLDKVCTWLNAFFLNWVYLLYRLFGLLLLLLLFSLFHVLNNETLCVGHLPTRYLVFFSLWFLCALLLNNSAPSNF